MFWILKVVLVGLWISVSVDKVESMVIKYLDKSC